LKKINDVLFSLFQGITRFPNDVKLNVDLIEDEGGKLIQIDLKVNDQELPLIIGKLGVHANAIRTIIFILCQNLEVDAPYRFWINAPKIREFVE